MHLDDGYDSAATRDRLAEQGCQAVISIKGFLLQAGARWVIERTNARHNRGFTKLAIRTEGRSSVINAFIALANAVIITDDSSRQQPHLDPHCDSPCRGLSALQSSPE